MRFKKEDWTPDVTVKSLKKELINYDMDFQVDFYGGWNEAIIRSFLHLNFHLVPNRTTQNHVEQITQILRGMITQ